MTRETKRAARPLRARAPAFRRHQVEAAIFRQLTDNPKQRPSREFLIRVKHLLELDRSIEPDPGYAFFDEPPAGKGDHSSFSAYDALLLYIGVQLLDTGLMRKEIVPLVRALRSENKFQRPLVGVIERRTAKLAVGDESLGADDPKADQNRVFLLLLRVENPADYLNATDRSRLIAGRALLRETYTALQAQLDDLPLTNIVILEVSEAAYKLPSLLTRTEVVARGRRPSG